MNSKLLYAATLAVSLISTLTLAGPASADQGERSRADVKAELAQAIGNGTLQRTDYDGDRSSSAATGAASNTTRGQVIVELAQAKASRKTLIGPDANRTYNPDGVGIYRHSDLSRAQVKAEVRQAAADGTLQRTDHDDAVLVARRSNAHTAATARLALRKAAALRSDS